MTRSLQSRLLLGLALGTSLVLVAAGLALYGLIRAELISEFDAGLAGEALALATLVEEERGQIKSEMGEHEVAKFQLEGRPIYFQVWDREGKPIERSAGLGSARLPRFGGTPEKPQFRAVVLPGGRAGRVVGFRFTPHRDGEEDRGRGSPLAGTAAEMRRASGASSAAGVGSIRPPDAPVTFVAARDTAPLEHTLQRIEWLLSAVFGGAVAASLLVTAPIVRVGLRPLQRISHRIASLDTCALTERLEAADAPDEIRSVVDCLNGLLDRLQEAFQRERAFSASVAHELRTPLAGLRSTIDVALAKPRDAADYRRSLEKCLTICLQSSSLTENLLMLARLDAGQFHPQREAVALDQLVHTVWAPLADEAASLGLKVSWRIDEPCEVFTDATLLVLILRNLLANAVDYADKKGWVNVEASVTEQRAIITVCNSVQALPPEFAERAFDRFWRGDSSRSATGVHAGLGLSLCRQASRALGADLAVNAQDGTFTARLEFR